MTGERPGFGDTMRIQGLALPKEPAGAKSSGANVVRFGEKAIELKLLTVEQVEQALAAQGDARRQGIDRSVGAWLHDRGYLDLVQVQQIMAAMGDAQGGRLIPDIQLLQLLGRGTSGAVYRGWSAQYGCDVAVKIRSPRRESDDPNAARFHLEGEIGQKLIHPNIVRLYTAGKTRDYTYHVLEYVEGVALDRLLKMQGKLAEQSVIDLGIQICSALECAAAAAIVHRDIKPANILMTNTGVAKLCDLGLAKDLSRNANLTAEGVLLGSPFYLAPEYARSGDVDARSDIYSLGVTLYHCATGFVPFPGKTAMEILQRVVREEAPDPRNYNAQLSTPFVAVVLKMIAKNPLVRYQSAREARDGLMALKSGGGMSSGGPNDPAGAHDSGAIKKLFSFFKRK